jgi:hypothetical protein
MYSAISMIFLLGWQTGLSEGDYPPVHHIVNNVFRLKRTLKKTRIKLYNTLALPTLLHGSENWTIKARDARRITATK